jgi:putative flippase GtrA
MRTIILRFLDFFYPIFKPFFDKQTYHYAVCGGINMLVDLSLYFFAFNFIFKKKIVQITETIAFEPYIAAFLFSFVITFPLGFALSKYIVWTESNIKGRVQLFRYFLLVLVNLFLNYALLKIFVETFHIFPTISKLLTIVIVVTISFLTQKYFTFKVKS